MSAHYDVNYDAALDDPDYGDNGACDRCEPESPCELHSYCTACKHGYGIRKNEGVCFDCLNEREAR